jgi:hypothetical protein
MKKPEVENLVALSLSDKKIKISPTHYSSVIHLALTKTIFFPGTLQTGYNFIGG